MEQSSCIDYKDFLSKRYDLVTKYYVLKHKQVKWDFHKARKFVINSDEWAFMREFYGKVFPVLVDKFDPGLKRKYGHDTGLAMAHNQFLLKNYGWIERAVRKRKGDWLHSRPYGIRPGNNKGIPTKRFLVVLKYDKPMWWCRESFLDSYKPDILPTQKRSNYKMLLTSEQYNMFEGSMKHEIRHMERLRFFHEDTRIRVKQEDYEK